MTIVLGAIGCVAIGVALTIAGIVIYIQRTWPW